MPVFIRDLRKNLDQDGSGRKSRMVRVKGLEPPRIAAPDPKSGVSTNSTTLAQN